MRKEKTTTAGEYILDSKRNDLDIFVQVSVVKSTMQHRRGIYDMSTEFWWGDLLESSHLTDTGKWKDNIKTDVTDSYLMA